MFIYVCVVCITGLLITEDLLLSLVWYRVLRFIEIVINLKQRGIYELFGLS